MNSYVVLDYAKDQNSSLYTTRACQENDSVPGLFDQNCKINGRRYKLENDYPIEQEFPFASTEGNESVFIPERIMESELGRNEYIHKYANKQDCFLVDPRDRFSEPLHCSGEKNENENVFVGDTEVYLFPFHHYISRRMLVFLLFIIMCVLSVIFILGIYCVYET